jgi:hypothetical protein
VRLALLLVKYLEVAVGVNRRVDGVEEGGDAD